MFYIFHKIRTFVAPGISRPGFCRMSTTTGIMIVSMFALLCVGFVRKYGGRFKK